MEVIVIFLGIALYLIWSEEGKPKAPPKPPEWQEVSRKRVTTIEEQPPKS